jgi:hypothetical protein
MASDLKRIRDELLAESFGDLAPAQQASDDRQSEANWSRIGSGLAGAISGGTYRPDDSYARGLEARGQRGVEQALQTGAIRNQAMDQARQVQKTEVEAGNQRELDDPAGQTSVGGRSVLMRALPGIEKEIPGFERMSQTQLAAIHPTIKALLDVEQKKAEAARAAELARLANIENDRRAARDHGYRMSEAEITSGIRATTDANKPPPTMPAGEAADLGRLSGAKEMIADLSKQWDSLVSAPGSGVASMVPGTAAARYQDAQLAAAQAIGAAIERGKITGPALAAKYMKLVPSPTDSKERKEAKIANLQRMLEISERETVGGLTKAGFNTGGFQAPAGEQPPAGGGGLSPEKKARLEELRAKRAAGAL